MPGLGNKGKGAKGAGARPARSRNSTPGSVTSLPLSVSSTGNTAFLDLQISLLAVPSNILYEDLLDRHGGAGGIPDSRHLQALITDLKTLSSLAGNRDETCDRAVRDLGIKRNYRQSFDTQTEALNRDAEEKARLKRAAEGDEAKENRSKRRKDQRNSREDRPLTVGAHGLAKQDGDVRHRFSPAARTKADSGSSSPLSPPSQLQSPEAGQNAQGTRAGIVKEGRNGNRAESVTGTGAKIGANTVEDTRARRSSSSSNSSDDSRQPEPAPSITHYRTFGDNPLTFDDPTVYHIRDITDDMTDEERRNIYCVAIFPRSDLKELTAGTPPDKDFSNAKPNNQVAATTFSTYIEPYLRPFGDEDISFLRERGDRANIFTVNARGPKHYRQVWAEEDGQTAVDRDNDKLPPNQARGSLEAMNDEVAQTDQMSLGPLTERVLSLMRSERRPTVDDKIDETGQSELTGTETSEHPASHADEAELPASCFSESSKVEWKIPSAKVDYASMDDRLKQELKYIGFLSQDDEASFDSHWDDEIAERIRILQTELRRISIENGARKALLLDKVKEHMAHQEYQTIQDDLDQQIVQAFLKRNRTMNKPSKNKKRPGGSTVPTAGAGPGIGKPGIGDVARTLIDRRRRWMDTLQGIFDEDFTKAKSGGDSLFSPETIKERRKVEEENWDEEADLGG